jgi:hypothetical protein
MKGEEKMSEGRRESVRVAAIRMGRSEDEVRFRLLHDYEYAYDRHAGEVRIRRRPGSTPPKFALFLKWLAENKTAAELPDAMRRAMEERDRRRGSAYTSVPAASAPIKERREPFTAFGGMSGGWLAAGVIITLALTAWAVIGLDLPWPLVPLLWMVEIVYMFVSAGHERRMRDPKAKLNWYDKIGMQYGPGGWSPLEDIFIGGPENSREWFGGGCDHD